MTPLLMWTREARRAVVRAQEEATSEAAADGVKLALGAALAQLQTAEMFLTGDPG